MDPGNKNAHRSGIKLSGLGRVVEESKWGREAARERYGKPQSPDTRPPDRSEPQKLGDRNNLRGPGWQGDTPNNWLRGNGHKPGFDRQFRPKGK